MNDETKTDPGSDREEEDPVDSGSTDALVLSEGHVLQTAGLTEEQIQELTVKYNQGMIDVAKKALELRLDVQVLDATLSTMADQTSSVTQAGDSVTMTHSHTSSLGRTEVIMGNTERAAKGRLTKSQSGEEDPTLKYLIIGAVVAIIIAFLVFG